MRMLIVGAGSVGGYFGGRLASAGRDVTFLVRRARLAQLAAGLTLVSHGEDSVIPVKAVTADEVAGKFDVILLAVKSYQLTAAINDCRASVGEETLILPVLNGMRHMDTLRSAFGSSQVLGGAAQLAASLDERGRILDHGRVHDLAYGEWNGEKSDRVLALHRYLDGAGFDARLSTEIEREMWEKWATLASLGAITCLMDGNIGEVARAPGGIELAQRLFGEVVAAIGVAWRPLSGEFKERSMRLFTDTASSMTSSLYRDMKAGHAVEADQIIGDLVARAAAHGVTTALLSAALVRLKVYEAKRGGG